MIRFEDGHIFIYEGLELTFCHSLKSVRICVTRHLSKKHMWEFTRWRKMRHSLLISSLDVIFRWLNLARFVKFPDFSAFMARNNVSDTLSLNVIN